MPVCLVWSPLSYLALALALRPPLIIMGGTSDRGTSSSGTPDTSLSLIDINDAPVGLSDPQYVQRKRKMLDAVNRLRAIG